MALRTQKQDPDVFTMSRDKSKGVGVGIEHVSLLRAGAFTEVLMPGRNYNQG